MVTNAEIDPLLNPHPGPLPSGEGEGRTLASALAAGPNNLDLIRLAAALLVLASHAFVLTGRAADEPIGILSHHLVDGGSLAVALFFVLSGFLIARSAQRHTTGTYLRARALRLYPAFLVVIAIQTFLLGPLLTSLPPGTYLTSPATWSALPRAILFSAPAELPGVFAHNPLPGIVNGSLWTLRIEALCYLGLLALARAGILRPGRILVPLAIAWAAQAAILAARANLLPPGLASLPFVALADCILDFLMGATLWVYAARIPHRLSLAAAGALALILLPSATMLHLMLPYLVLFLGLTRPILPPIPDLSYGTYLYAFPIQQTLAALLAPATLPLIMLSIPLTLACAALSWHLIEQPALRLKASWGG
jgi:peptidoglycan/LPS O-acetylase OafA/YrhL